MKHDITVSAIRSESIIKSKILLVAFIIALNLHLSHCYRFRASYTSSAPQSSLRNLSEKRYGEWTPGIYGSPVSEKEPTEPKEAIVVCNWKCYTTSKAASEQIKRFATMEAPENIRLISAPPSLFLTDMVKAFNSADSRCIPCSQDVSASPVAFGAFTGEVTAGMLKDIGVNWTIIGHSERRERGAYGVAEQPELINKKLRAALNSDLNAIVCIGEASNGCLEDVLEQIQRTFVEVDDVDARILMAYEPSTSVGSDKPVHPDKANEAIGFFKERIGERFRNTKFLYGGSVGHQTARDYIRQPNIDGIMLGRMWQDEQFESTLDKLYP